MMGDWMFSCLINGASLQPHRHDAARRPPYSKRGHLQQLAWSSLPAVESRTAWANRTVTRCASGSPGAGAAACAPFTAASASSSLRLRMYTSKASRCVCILHRSHKRQIAFLPRGGICHAEHNWGSQHVLMRNQPASGAIVQVDRTRSSW